MPNLQIPQKLLVGLLLVGSLAARNGHAQNSTPQAEDSVSNASPIPWDSASSGWAGRLVIGEYGTAMSCGPCQEDDREFNALLQRYPATTFISLTYHVGVDVPMHDPADSLLTTLLHWYGGADVYPQFKSVFTSPIGFNRWIDGRSIDAGQPDELQHAVDAELKRPPEARMSMTTTVHDGQLLVRVQVDTVLGAHPKNYLRIVLIEDTVNLLGNGVIEAMPRQVNHMVVRGIAHTNTLSAGLPLQTNAPMEHTFDVAAIQARYLKYHTFGKDSITVRSSTWNDSTGHWKEDAGDELMVNWKRFRDVRDWQIDPLRLHVVAFVQDAATGEVLQGVLGNIDPQAAKTLLSPKAQPVWSGTAADSVWMRRWGYRPLSH